VLDNLGIDNFEDYALMLPSLSYQSAGPGLSQLYMRGASDGGDGNASGSSPSVAVYLDEQPVTAIGRNLDVHIYDIARVEAIAGPQGTLFGASSQGGTLRIITNKPNADEFEAGFDIGYSDTKDGDDSYSIEGFVNQPLGDNAAIRLVAWNKEDGGYIDNIASSRSLNIYEGTAAIAEPQNNDAIAKDDFNTLENTGARAALKVDLNENWTTTVSVLTQTQETEGVWFHSPESENGEVGDLEVQRYNDDSSEDEFTQFAITLEGDLGFASLTYAGSLLDRDVEYNNDYSDYAAESGFVSKAACGYDYSGYYDSGTVTSPCTSANIFYEEDNEYSRQTHELRLQSQGDSKLQYTAGLYYEDSSHEYLQEWLMPGMAQGDGYGLFENSDGIPLWYITDQERVDKQTAVFGEVSYDLTDQLTATVGGRYFDNETTLKGQTNYGFLVYQEPPENAIVNQKNEDSDSIYKVNISYNIDDTKNIYATWSEGYRAGGINRASNDIIDQIYKPDFLTNYEFGWKTTWMEDRLRWNGAVYLMQWEDMQFTQYDGSYGVPVGVTVNLGESEIKGLETDLTFIAAEGLTLSAAMAYNQAELTEDFEVGGNSSPDGTELPHVPELKYNLSGRYEFMLGDVETYTQLVYAYVDDSQNNIYKFEDFDTSTDTRETQDSYENLNFTAGIDLNNWGVDLYVNNLTDERAEITRGVQPYGNYITTNRPRTIGIKYRMRF
jgi:outer membrane receptor protein involved in Fe transport